MFSVREVPWHGLGAVLDTYPTSINEALERAGLGWRVTHCDVLVVKTPQWTDDVAVKHPAKLVPAKSFKANLRGDTGEVLGIVRGITRSWTTATPSDALIGSDMHFETRQQPVGRSGRALDDRGDSFSSALW